MEGRSSIVALALPNHSSGSEAYGTVWTMLLKIREALRQRDEQYKLKNVIELDGAVFGRRRTGNQAEVLVAVESKDWVDKNGRKKSKAGFAKVLVANETKKEAQAFVNQAIVKDSLVNTDGSPSLINLENVDIDFQIVAGSQEVIDRWLPWVHKFISNAKTWLNGTHHGVDSKYLAQYLAEYTFRFNRRHDPDSLKSFTGARRVRAGFMIFMKRVAISLYSALRALRTKNGTVDAYYATDRLSI